MTIDVRSPSDDDCWQLLEWRNSERVRRVSVDDREIDRATHAAWFRGLLSERSDQFLVVVWGDHPVGVVQLERLDLDDRVSSWGCHLGDIDVPPGVGASLPLIGLALGFGRFNLRRMTAQVIASNRNMASMHRRFGIPAEGRRREHVRRRDGTLDDVHEYGVLRNEWREIADSGSRLLPQQVRHGVDRVIGKLVDTMP